MRHLSNHFHLPLPSLTGISYYISSSKMRIAITAALFLGIASNTLAYTCLEQFGCPWTGKRADIIWPRRKHFDSPIYLSCFTLSPTLIHSSTQNTHGWQIAVTPKHQTHLPSVTVNITNTVIFPERRSRITRVLRGCGGTFLCVCVCVCMRTLFSGEFSERKFCRV